MKIKLITLFICLIFFGHPVIAEDSKNYVLSVDGKDYEINLDGSVVAKTKNGKNITIRLKRKEFSTFVSVRSDPPCLVFANGVEGALLRR